MKIGKVGSMNVEVTDHFMDRVEERHIDLDNILYNLSEKKNILRLYNDTGLELCCKNDNLTFFFEVREGKIALITALDKRAKYITEGTKKGTVVI